MEFRLFLYFVTTFIIAARVAAAKMCDITDRDDCVYTVVCEEHAGSASNPRNCNKDPYVTLVIKNSVVNTLTSGFFGATNFDSRVRIIKAIGNTWNDIESITFRYYTKSEKIDLSHNKIKNIRNEAFKSLIALKSLNLSGNAIESLNDMTFMITESRNNNLEVLDLSFNQLTDLSGDVFSSLPELITLFLNNNKIKSINEECFRNIKKLKSLYLQRNYLTALNMTLISLKSLVELDVSYNNLKNISSYEINRLVSLEKVNMSCNLIEFIESTSFTEAVNLVYVDLRYNKIKSPIDSAMFKKANKLSYLNLYHNNISQIHDGAFKNNTLTYLNLEGNHLCTIITENTFAGLINLTSLNLANQSIIGIKNYAFPEGNKLTYLNLSMNHISNIENSSFAYDDSLNILDISFNNISSITFLINYLTNLTELYLNNNNIKILPKNAFVNQTLLKRLDISKNNIVNIDQYSFPLKNLQYLNLNNNPITGPIKSNVFSPAKYLRYLDLANFKWEEIDTFAFIDLPVVARLNLSCNDIKYVDPYNFNGMPNMFSLDISHNQLSDLNVNSSLNNLKALYLGNNKLKNIPKALVNMSSLLYLDLSFNEISELSNVNLTQLSELKVLHLSYNKIKIFNSPSVNSLSKLTDLNLSSNQLKYINLSYFGELVSVDLSNNGLSNINDTFFINLDYLQSLDISNNNITEFAPGTFKFLKFLKLLNLSHNHISKLRYGIFKGLHRTEVLDLSFNDLVDIEVDVFHECVELKRLIIDYNRLSNLEVERLIHIVPELMTLSLGGNPISCREIVGNVNKFNKNMLRQVEITAVDKVYHEDNVHGIRCGDKNATMNTEISPKKPETNEPQSTSHGVIIWCSILTIMIIGAALSYFIYYYVYKKSNTVHRMRFSSSFEFTGSSVQEDLLN